MDSLLIIEALGGHKDLAFELGVVRTAVFNWVKYGIPKSRCMQLAEIARARKVDKGFKDRDGIDHPGITLEILMLSTPFQRVKSKPVIAAKPLNLAEKKTPAKNLKVTSRNKCQVS